MKNTITTKDTFGNEKTYQVVEKIPERFFVWNIGENMGNDEYIPICESLFPLLPKTDYRHYHINPETVKAIKLNPEEVKALRKAAGYGINSKDSAEKALKSKRAGRMADRKRKEAEATIEIFNRITAYPDTFRLCNASEDGFNSVKRQRTDKGLISPIY